MQTEQQEEEQLDEIRRLKRELRSLKIKKLKGKLLRAFPLASGCLLGAIGGTYLSKTDAVKSVISPVYELVHGSRHENDLAKAIKTTPLTQGEAAIAKMVFGPTFNTNAITKSYFARQDSATVCGESGSTNTRVLGCVPRGQTSVFMPEPDIFIDDFSRDGGSAHNRTFVFFHEMTHVWQGMTNAPDYRCTDEDYDASKPFDSYCHEEQGNLIGRYVTIYLMPNRMMHDLQYFIAEGGPKTAEYREFQQKFESIRDIVETRLPHVRPHRLRQEENVTRMLACWQAAGQNESQSDACTRQHYVNPLGQPLTTSAQEVTFTLPDGRVTRPAVRLDPALLTRR